MRWMRGRVSEGRVGVGWGAGGGRVGVGWGSGGGRVGCGAGKEGRVRRGG